MSAAMMQDMQDMQESETREPIRKLRRGGGLTMVKPAQPRASTAPAQKRRLSDAPATALAELSTLLAEAVASGDGLMWLTAHAATFPLLDAAEEARLGAAAHAGDVAAQERMTLCNLRLVVKMARRAFAVAGSLELCELINEGVIGLMHATELFDPATGNRFSTYATWWIAQAIHRSIAQSGAQIRLPVYLYERKRYLLRLRSQLLERWQREPTLDELVEAYAAQPLRNRMRGEAARTLDREDVALLLTLHQPVDSLDRVVTGSQNSRMRFDQGHAQTLGELQEDSQAARRFEAVEMSEDARWMLEVARYTLRDNPRMYAIWEARALSETGDGTTLEAVGQQYGLTRERVRQIFEVANARVRAALVECGMTPPRPLEEYPVPYDERHRAEKRAWEREQRAAEKAAAAAEKTKTKRPIGRPRKTVQSATPAVGKAKTKGRVG